jgi:hypothetical protein
MSYLGVSAISKNQSMRDRVAACAAAEGNTFPESWTAQYALHWASAPGWDAAWASAEVAAPGADHGKNEGVITDAMILSQVQAVMAAHEEPPAP